MGDTVKRALAWHKECLEHFENYLRRDIEKLMTLEERINIAKIELDFRRHQILQAEKEGLAEFDSDRFCVKRGRK